MFSQKPCYFYQLSKTYPILRLVDVYDRQSFLRAYILDNVYACIFMYILFYAALWYASNVIKRAERSNQELLASVKENRLKLNDLITLRNKRTEFDEIVMKTKDTQRETSKYLENETRRLSAELASTSEKIIELEKIHGKWLFSGRSEPPAGDAWTRENERIAQGTTDEKFKILEPSFPPPLPPEPPPRKYGIFVTRPPGQRRAPTAVAAATAPTKIGFK